MTRKFTMRSGAACGGPKINSSNAKRGFPICLREAPADDKRYVRGYLDARARSSHTEATSIAAYRLSFSLLFTTRLRDLISGSVSWSWMETFVAISGPARRYRRRAGLHDLGIQNLQHDDVLVGHASVVYDVVLAPQGTAFVFLTFSLGCCQNQSPLIVTGL